MGARTRGSRDWTRRERTVAVVAAPELTPGRDLRSDDKGVWNVIIEHQSVRNARTSRRCSEHARAVRRPVSRASARDPHGRHRAVFETPKSFFKAGFFASDSLYTSYTLHTRPTGASTALTELPVAPRKVLVTKTASTYHTDILPRCAQEA